MPDAELIRTFRDNSADKPMQAGYKVCWSQDKQQAVRIAHALWANEAVLPRLRDL